MLLACQPHCSEILSEMFGCVLGCVPIVLSLSFPPFPPVSEISVVEKLAFTHGPTLARSALSNYYVHTATAHSGVWLNCRYPRFRISQIDSNDTGVFITMSNGRELKN
jgi:hypothetical protein